MSDAPRGAPGDAPRDPWGEQFDWARLGRRSDEKIRAMRAAGRGAAGVLAQAEIFPRARIRTVGSI